MPDFSQILSQWPMYLSFGAIAVVVIGTALAMLLSRNAIYAALFLVLNFVSVGILYLFLGAPFIALAQVAVYAGAIMVLFLFVIMLLGGERLPAKDPLKLQRPIAIILAVLLAFELAFVALSQLGVLPPLGEPEAAFSTPLTLGEELFNTFALPFEITSLILLVALVGAILLTRGEKKNGDDIPLQNGE